MKLPKWNPEGFWRSLRKRVAEDGGPVLVSVGRRRAKLMRRESDSGESPVYNFCCTDAMGMPIPCNHIRTGRAR